METITKVSEGVFKKVQTIEKTLVLADLQKKKAELVKRLEAYDVVQIKNRKSYTDAIAGINSEIEACISANR